MSRIAGMSKKTALEFIANEPWAIREEWLETICSIAERENEYANNLTALEQKLGRPLNNTHSVSVRDGVAIVPVAGPLFRHANLFTMLSGATSYDLLATDIRAAVDDPSVSAIILSLDSPGGAVSGVNELAKQIYAVRGTKPIVAYVGGQACSAGYWLASACDEIVADDVATIGSIGASLGVRISADRAGEKSYTFVSSQSPLKNASPETEAGSAELKRLVDEYAQVFVESVAKYRGETVQNVLTNYGQGAVFAGTAALQRGMVDKIGTLEGVIASLSEKRAAAYGGKFKGASAMTPQEQAAAFAAEHPEAAALLRTEGSAGERARIAAVREQSLPGHEDLIETLAADGVTTGEQAAVAVLAAERERVKAAGESRFAGAQAPIKQAAAADDETDAGDKVVSINGRQVNAERAKLDAAAKAYAKEHGVDYVTAVHAVSNKGA